MQAVEVEMVQGERPRLILVANGKTGAADFVGTAHTTCQTARERRLAAAQITDQLDYFATAQPTPQLLGEPLGRAYAGRSGLPGHDGTHTLHIVAPPRQRRQVSSYVGG